MSLTQCKNWRCGALYESSLNWYYGFHDRNEGLTLPQDLVRSGSIPADVCPICRVPKGKKISGPTHTTAM